MRRGRQRLRRRRARRGRPRVRAEAPRCCMRARAALTRRRSRRLARLRRRGSRSPEPDGVAYLNNASAARDLSGRYTSHVRYVVFGAGAVGGAIAARLSLAGRDVVAIARGEHLRAMRRGGLRLVTPDADELVRLDAVEDPSAARIASDDVVLLCVKSNDTAAALTALAAVAPPDV